MEAAANAGGDSKSKNFLFERKHDHPTLPYRRTREKIYENEKF